MAGYEYTALDVIKRMGEDEAFRIELLLLIDELLRILKDQAQSN